MQDGEIRIRTGSQVTTAPSRHSAQLQPMEMHGTEPDGRTAGAHPVQGASGSALVDVAAAHHIAQNHIQLYYFEHALALPLMKPIESMDLNGSAWVSSDN